MFYMVKELQFLFFTFIGGNILPTFKEITRGNYWAVMIPIMFMSAVKLIGLCVNKNLHSENMQKERERCVVSEFQLFPRLSQNLTSETQQTFYEYYIE